MRQSFKPFAVRIYQTLVQFGVDPFRFVRSFRNVPRFLTDWVKFSRSFKTEKVSGFDSGMIFFPQVGERHLAAGTVASHYFQMDLYVAQLICEREPIHHLDVGSRIDGFVAHVATSRPIQVLDIRPLNAVIKNITFQQADLMDEGADWESKAAGSVSCLHALEHFGLGRYGDRLDPLAHEKGLRNLARLVKDGGLLYLAVPISVNPRIEFNAHRVFSFPHLKSLVSNSFEIESVAIVNDKGELQEGLDGMSDEANQSWNCHYGCGILTLRRKSN
ncbi:MAG: DUF268 domain-containing protein [Verrucomicrobiales bacterium]|nr:DUF268 domain-containing protein [Verrucomicrobiales bacterium]